MRLSKTQLIQYVFSVVVVCGVMFAVAAPVLANGDDAHEHEAAVEEVSIGERVRSMSVKLAIGAAIILSLLVVIALVTDEKSESFKKTLFISMVIVIAVPTLYFISTTIYINAISETGGPVHWHADFRIFHCGEEFEPPEPEGLSNKVGTPVLHEHVDQRIHVEGVLLKKEDASLANFFRVQGGELTEEYFAVPTKEGVITIRNGEFCPDGSRGIWQAFLYKTEGNVATQRKLENYTDYVLSPEVNVPPGDCIIMEFAPPKPRTDKICGKIFQTEVEKGNLEIR